MKSFGYCLWLVPGIRNKVINFTDGFKPHITIKKELTKFQSFEEKQTNFIYLQTNREISTGFDTFVLTECKNSNFKKLTQYL